MSNYDLGTVGFTFQNTGLNETVAGLNKVEQAANKISPAAQRIIDNMKRVRDMQRQVAQSSETLGRSLTKLELERAAQRMQNFENALANTRGNMNNFGVVTQQAGYQIGDFLVQVQSGTNWMVALGQQATQLVGVLPMMNGLFGLSTSALVGLSAGLGIAIPLITAIGAYFIRAGEASEEASGKIDKQTQAYQNLIDKVAELSLQRQMEATGTQTTDEQIALNEVNALLRERQELQNQILLSTSQEMLIASQGRSALMAAFLSDENERKQARIDEINAVLERLDYERTLEIAARRRANELREQYIQERKMIEAHADQVKLMGEQRAEQLRMTSAAQEALNKYGMMRTVAAGVAREINNAANAAEKLASIRIKGVDEKGNTIFDPRNPNYDPAKAAQESKFGFTYGSVSPFSSSKALKETGSSRQEDLKKEIELTKELTQAEKERQTIINSIEGTLEQGFMAMIEGTKSVKDAFKQMAYEIIKELYRVLVVQRMVGGISSAVGLFAGPSTGSFGLPFGRESGGTMMANTPYLVGERGPEIVVPRHSGTVINADKTSKAIGAGGDITVQNNISVTGSDAAAVRAEVAKMIPQITNATKAAIIDAKQRGGQIAAAFR